MKETLKDAKRITGFAALRVTPRHLLSLHCTSVWTGMKRTKTMTATLKEAEAIVSGK
jgi:hypothetical protein